jgi:drug/metabolite transporter (DMT)-like permease
MAEASLTHSSHAAHSQTRIGFAFILAAVVGYSFLPVFSNFLTESGMTAQEIALWRYSLTMPIYAVSALIVSRFVPIPATSARITRSLGAKIVLLGTLLAIAAVTAFWGLSLISAGTYVVIFYTYPAITAVLSMLFGDRLSRWGWIALALTILGVMLTAPDFSAGLSGDNFVGVMLALINAFVVAIYFIFNGRLLRGIRGITSLLIVSTLVTSGALIVLGVWSIATGVNLPPTSSAWLYLIGLVLISTVLPVFSLNIAIQNLGAARAAILGSVEPLLTSVIAMIFLSQVMLPVQWVGGLIIVASVILLQTLGAKKA